MAQKSLAQLLIEFKQNRPGKLEQLGKTALERFSKVGGGVGNSLEEGLGFGNLADFIAARLTGSTPEIAKQERLKLRAGQEKASEVATKLPPALDTGDKIARFAGSFLADAPLFMASAPASIGVTAASRAGGSRLIPSLFKGELAQSAILAPVEFASRPPEEAAAVTALGVPLGVGAALGFKQLGKFLAKRETTEKVAENLLTRRPVTEGLDSEEELSKALFPSRKENLEVAQVLHDISPRAEWDALLANDVAEGNLKSLDVAGQKVRTKGMSVKEITDTHTNDEIAEIYTSDGKLSTKDAINAKDPTVPERNIRIKSTSKTANTRSVLDMVRPGATLAERSQVLLNGDVDTFATVSSRFKTPKAVIERLITQAEELPVENRGQFLFQSLKEQAHIAARKGDVDVFQVPKYNSDHEQFTSLRLDIEESNAKYVPPEQAAPQADEFLDRAFTQLEQGTEIPAMAQIRAARLANLKSVSNAAKSGDMELADLLLNTHVSTTKENIDIIKLREIADTSLKDVARIGVNSPHPWIRALQNYALKEINLVGTKDELPGLALHFPEVTKIATDPATGKIIEKPVTAVLAQLKHTNKKEALGNLLRHEYGHGLWHMLGNLTKANHPEARKLRIAFVNAAKVHDWRKWDKISEAVNDVQGANWPKDPLGRVGKPPIWDDVHGSSDTGKIKEKIADIIALWSTKEGRASINPNVRNILEPFFGKIKEPFAPPYKLTLEEAFAFEPRPSFVKGYRRVNTVKDAGKAMTSVAQENQIRLNAVQAAVDPNTGKIPAGATKVLQETGPVASQALADTLDSAGPFSSKQFMLNNLQALEGEVELKDFMLTLSRLRASSLVAGISSNLANIASDVGQTLIQSPITLLAAGADAAKVALGLQAKRELFAGEALSQLKGQFDQVFGANAALPNTLRQFGSNIRHSKEFIAHPDYTGKLIANVHNKEFQKVAGFLNTKIIQTPFNILQWADDYFYNINFAGNMYKQAYLKSVKEGLPFDEAFSGIQKQLKTFDEDVVSLYERSIQQAKLKLQPQGAEKLTETKVFGKDSESILHGREAGEVTEQGTLGEGFSPTGEKMQLQPSLFGDNPAAVEFTGQSIEEIGNLARRYVMENIPQNIKEAKLGAERAIFVAREGKPLDGVLDILDKLDNQLLGAISLALPFRRTPANIIREGLRTSPFGFLPLIAKALGKGSAPEIGSREASLLIGQAALGTMAFYTIWQNIINGNIKGQSNRFNPNKAQRDTHAALGNRPGSITLDVNLFEDVYTIPIERLQPIGGAILGLMGYKEELDLAKASGAPIEALHEKAVGLAWNVSAELGLGDFSRNLGDLFDAINASREVGKTPAAKRYLAQLGASFVPSGIRQTRLGLGEPFLRPEESSLVKAPLAGVKASLGIAGNERVGLFGQTKRPGPGGAVGVLSGGSVGQIQNDPIIEKMAEVGAYHQAPQISDFVKKLDKKQQTAFQVGKGHLQRQYVERVVLNPGFAGLDPEAQRRLINRAFSGASTLADKRAKAVIKLRGFISEQAIVKGRI